MNQTVFISNLIKSCEDMENSISGIRIYDSNRNVTGYKITDEVSIQFRKFKSDIDTYYTLYPSDEQQNSDILFADPMNLGIWIDDIEVYIHTLLNNLYLHSFPQTTKKEKLCMNKVFIVHGHDDIAKTETARVVEKLGLQAIILHEQASSGNTIIEKIEQYSDVSFAIVLYTPCDEGRLKGENVLKNRARQNVVFEHGYLIGKLGRKRVCALVKGDVEVPGDISGVVYIPIDSAGAWKFKLIDEMNAVGFKLDKNRI